MKRASAGSPVLGSQKAELELGAEKHAPAKARGRSAGSLVALARPACELSLPANLGGRVVPEDAGALRPCSPF